MLTGGNLIFVVNEYIPPAKADGHNIHNHPLTYRERGVIFHIATIQAPMKPT